MAKIINADFRNQSTQIHLSLEQYAHFTAGDGLFIKGPGGEMLGFIHEDTFEHAINDLAVLERMSEARAKMALIAATLTPGQPLELGPDMQMGLAVILDEIQEGLSPAEDRV